ncbi:hypothetical protein N7532_005109 [Penicillium argentinense]|uniref:Uncharacterized protein n=1 Tax=Penicillium argentinense TaxID=1131581 RepID=A0A9W9FDB2_9EURO|nr:uncharacterized protein N7532_005109 [Penicillium argentinense]KAJ5098108.1 hypothetical protein N7532_005109 [Penicillium argentinense]
MRRMQAGPIRGARVHVVDRRNPLAASSGWEIVSWKRMWYVLRVLLQNAKKINKKCAMLLERDKKL